MRIRTASAEDREDLSVLGSPEADAAHGVVFVASRGLRSWQEAEDELSDAFTLAQQASMNDADIVFVVDSDAMLGRASALDSMVATGLVSGARCLAFEGLRRGRYVGIIATDRTDSAGDLASAVQFAVETRAGLGQVIALGTGHAGGMFP
ncbi:hypothetical protein JCM18899A_21890 [Nocardioides sp. AN3]